MRSVVYTPARTTQGPISQTMGVGPHRHGGLIVAVRCYRTVTVETVPDVAAVVARVDELNAYHSTNDGVPGPVTTLIADTRLGTATLDDLTARVGERTYTRMVFGVYPSWRAGNVTVVEVDPAGAARLPEWFVSWRAQALTGLKELVTAKVLTLPAHADVKQELKALRSKGGQGPRDVSPAVTPWLEAVALTLRSLLRGGQRVQVR